MILTTEGKDKVSVEQLAWQYPKGEKESLERNKEGKAKGTWTDNDLTKAHFTLGQKSRNASYLFMAKFFASQF